MLSMKDEVAITSSNRKVAVYKGLKVAVYTVDKPELSLSRSDLIELINVCIHLLIQSRINIFLNTSVVISTIN